MALIHEIHAQKPHVRYALFALSLMLTLSVVGFFWLTGVQKQLYFAVHPDQKDRDAFVAQREDQSPKPLAILAKRLGSLTASIGSLLGFDQSAGFDRPSQQGTVYLLPTSK